jgi:uncharacterized integral membrane protein (TIGR00698 family)
MASAQIRRSIPEDWVVVILGFLIIFLAIFGFRPVAPSYGWTSPGDLATKVFNAANLGRIGIQFLFVLFIACLGVLLTGRSLKAVLYSFPLVYVLTVIALVLAGNQWVKSINLEAVIFSLGVGLTISNVFKLPQWFRDSLSTELFVKIGLVILGTTIVFSDVLKAGSFGLIQALVVVISVWYFAYWLCGKLKIDKELTMMISSAVSICGVSAAIATAGAINGDTKKLSYVISLVLICAIPMMIGMPYIAHALGLSQAVTGAWLGGSIDTTGAVVASGTLVGEEALKISTIVKFSQNVLLGIAAFVISVYWTYSKKSVEGIGEKPTLRVIWDRFPKFVLGFVGASLLFSFALDAGTIATVKDSLRNSQSLWFVLAFTSIGLETNFKDLLKGDNRKPMYAFLLAQLFNVVITLVVAYILFR